MAEGHVLENSVSIGLVDHRRATKASAALCILALEQMALARSRAKNFAFGGDFKPLGSGFFGLNTFGSTHNSNTFLSKRARNIGGSAG
jgi:hypothetical protein